MKKVLLILLFCVSSLFAIENLTANNFDQKISGKNVIVDFYYTWWGACKVLGKNLQKYNTSKKQDVTIYKVNLGEEKLLKKRFNVTSFPLIIFFKDGKVVARELGIKSPTNIEKSVLKYFK